MINMYLKTKGLANSLARPFVILFETKLENLHSLLFPSLLFG